MHYWLLALGSHAQSTLLATLLSGGISSRRSSAGVFAHRLSLMAVALPPAALVHFATTTLGGGERVVRTRGDGPPGATVCPRSTPNQHLSQQLHRFATQPRNFPMHGGMVTLFGDSGKIPGRCACHSQKGWDSWIVRDQTAVREFRRFPNTLTLC